MLSYKSFWKRSQYFAFIQISLLSLKNIQCCWRNVKKLSWVTMDIRIVKWTSVQRTCNYCNNYSRRLTLKGLLQFFGFYYNIIKITGLKMLSRCCGRKLFRLRQRTVASTGRSIWRTGSNILIFHWHFHWLNEWNQWPL